MPNLAFYHPQIVHFVLALLGAGVLLRWIALTGKWPWTSPAAAALLLAGTLAAVAAVQSGTDAHGPVERIPGVRGAVVEHEEWGERTRNVFLVVGALEILALAFATRPWRRWRDSAGRTRCTKRASTAASWSTPTPAAWGSARATRPT